MKRKLSSKRRIRRHLILVIWVILIIIFLYFISIKFKRNNNPGAKVESAKNGWLKTDGGKIYDSNNKQVIFRGINYGQIAADYEDDNEVNYNIPEMPDVCKATSWEEPPQELNFDKIKEWGFNAVRLGIFWDALEPKKPYIDENGNIIHLWNVGYLKTLDKYVNGLSKRNIYIILDMHQFNWSSIFLYTKSGENVICSASGFPRWFYSKSTPTNSRQALCDFFAGVKPDGAPINPMEGFIDVWKLLAQRYKNNNYVSVFDILNEPWVTNDPCSAKDINLADFYFKVGKAIREINPNVLLLLEDNQNYEREDFSIVSRPDLPNLIYSYHLYWDHWDSAGRNDTERYFHQAQKLNMPLVIGEFDAFRRAYNLDNRSLSEDWREEMRTMFTYFRKRDISWFLWGYSGDFSLMKPYEGNPKEELLSILQEDIFK